jgi:hypothetical protein
MVMAGEIMTSNKVLPMLRYGDLYDTGRILCGWLMTVLIDGEECAVLLMTLLA